MCVVIFAVVAPFALDKYFLPEGEAKAPTTVLTMWHVDTFEGGTGSRQDFLMKTALEFSKKYRDAHVMVVKHTEDSVKENFAKGITPDLISFGNGVEGVINYAKPLKTQVNNQFFNSSAVGGVAYFYPYAYGVYAVFSLQEGAIPSKPKGIVVSKGKSNLAGFALLQEGVEGGEYVEPLLAYTSFVSGKAKKLVGTQRDAYRLIRRGVQFVVEPFASFTDLVQYVAVTAKEGARAEKARRFAEFLILEETQKRLGEIGLFSPLLFDVEYGEDEINTLSKVAPSGVLSGIISSGERVKLLNNDGQKKYFKKFQDFVRY